MKGIILAGGSGTRLYPITMAVSKQLMPIYDKPMIYYPISTLLYAGIKEILIITTPEDRESFIKLLGDGSRIGCKFFYEIQENPNGLAQAFVIGEKFIKNDKVCLILGDNIFYSPGFSEKLKNFKNINGAGIFAYWVDDPERYGVVDFDDKGKALSIEEKPKNPKSNFAVPGIYFYDNSVVKIAKNISPSSRGEYEITDVNKYYLNNGLLKVSKMDKGSVWLDTGTVDSLNDATEFVRVIEKRQGLKIGCIEEAAYKNNLINKEELKKNLKNLVKSSYGEYLKKIINK